jgi:hypothetical protein
LAIASLAQSSQQTVISLPPTVTFTPPSVISQSQTGHFDVAIVNLRLFESYENDTVIVFSAIENNLGRNDQAIRFLLISRMALWVDLRRIADGVSPNSRRKTSVK